jgi:hypothetical protein
VDPKTFKSLRLYRAQRTGTNRPYHLDCLTSKLHVSISLLTLSRSGLVPASPKLPLSYRRHRIGTLNSALNKGPLPLITENIQVRDLEMATQVRADAFVDVIVPSTLTSPQWL